VISIKYKYYAIDFDGTLVDANLKPLPYAIYVMNRIKEHGGEIAIWTCRTGEDLQIAIRILNENNIPYDCINETLPSFVNQWGNDGRKIWAEVYIDDLSIHNRNGIDWYEIEKWIFEEDLS
jgi:hydroxymethylpyrimidine pyrophosphatase-like HAD family hydrolase